MKITKTYPHDVKHVALWDLLFTMPAEHRYLAFDADGEMWSFQNLPVADEEDQCWYSTGDDFPCFVGRVNDATRWKEEIFEVEDE